MLIESSQKSLKTQLRKEIRRRRANIGMRQRKQWDTLINQHLDELSRQTQIATVAAYLAFDGEPDLSPALANLSSNGVRLALPVIQDTPGKAIITFRHWEEGSELKPNRYGIDEPPGKEDIRVTEIDLVLIPLVGWDRSGARLGMGASFYDRLFQPFAELDKPVRMGVGYELQNVSSIPKEPWDVHLHSVLTENGWFTCGN